VVDFFEWFGFEELFGCCGCGCDLFFFVGVVVDDRSKGGGCLWGV